MNARDAETYLPCYRAGKRMDARVLKATRVAEGDEALAAKLADQMDFDEQMVGAIQGIKPPEGLRARLGGVGAGAKAAPSLRQHAFHPTILCAIAGALLIIGFLIYSGMDHLADFPGKENAERMVDQLGNMSGVELDPTQAKAGALVDWFYMRGFESFALPADLAALTAAGTRTFKLNGQPVAQVAIDEHNTILTVFRATDFGVRLDAAGGWTFFEQEGWAAAIRQQGEVATLLAFKGERAEMEKFVQSLKP